MVEQRQVGFVLVKKLRVSNFPYRTTEPQLRVLFEQYGSVHSLEFLRDRETGRSRGLAFVEMDDPAAHKAIAALDGINFGGRILRVSEAKLRRRPRHRTRPQ